MAQLQLFVFALLALQLSFAPIAAATEMPPSFSQGKEYFDQGRFDEAYAELHKAFVQAPTNVEINFYLGRAAFESGRLEEAVMAFDRILIADPDANRAKLELARAHLRLGSNELAKQYFKEVQATNPPEQVWKNIQHFLDAIATSEQRHFVNGLFTFGVSRDDNVNVAPAETSVNVSFSGITLPVTIDQTPISDQIYNTTLVANHIYKFEDSPYTWKTTAVNYNAFYENQNVHDINFLSLASGPVFQGQNYLWQVQGLANTVDLEYDRYQSAYGLSSTLTWLVDQTILFNIGATAQQKNNYQDGDKDADNYMITAGPIFTLGPNRITLALGKEIENAAHDYNSYGRFSLLARYDRQLPLDFGFFASFRFQNTNYDKTDPLFIYNRSDDVLDLSCGVSKRLWQAEDKRQSLAGQISYTNTKAESNVALYEYDKNVTAAELTLAF
jgi:tetratricopeptide (TPR) repeat protein